MSMAGKTAFVTGPTGFLGGALARRLAAEGAQVRALARSPARAGYIQNVPGIEIVQGDITMAGSLTAAMSGCDYVFHVAAAFGDWNEQRRVNVEGTRHVMQAAAEAGVGRVVFVSSIAAYGYGRAGTITEDDPLTPTRADPYSVTKAEAEAVVRDFGAQRGVSYAIIRPGMIYGPRSGQWTDVMFKLARRPLILWVGDGSGSTFPIHVDDVVDLMLVLAAHPAAHNETFNGVHDQPVTWRDFLLSYGRLAGNPHWLGIPTPMFIAFARWIGAVGLPGSRWKAAPEASRSITSQRIISMAKARDRLGWEPKIDLPTGIESCIPYLRDKGLLR